MYENLHTIMRNHGISQSQIASLLNIRPATVSDKINGKTRFYFDEAEKIKNVFFPGYEIEYLFSSKNVMN